MEPMGGPIPFDEQFQQILRRGRNGEVLSMAAPTRVPVPDQDQPTLPPNPELLRKLNPAWQAPVDKIQQADMGGPVAPPDAPAATQQAPYYTSGGMPGPTNAQLGLPTTPPAQQMPPAPTYQPLSKGPLAKPRPAGPSSPFGGMVGQAIQDSASLAGKANQEAILPYQSPEMLEPFLSGSPAAGSPAAPATPGHTMTIRNGGVTTNLNYGPNGLQGVSGGNLTPLSGNVSQGDATAFMDRQAAADRMQRTGLPFDPYGVVQTIRQFAPAAGLAWESSPEGQQMIPHLIQSLLHEHGQRSQEYIRQGGETQRKQMEIDQKKSEAEDKYSWAAKRDAMERDLVNKGVPRAEITTILDDAYEQHMESLRQQRAARTGGGNTKGGSSTGGSFEDTGVSGGPNAPDTYKTLETKLGRVNAAKVENIIGKSNGVLSAITAIDSALPNSVQANFPELLRHLEFKYGPNSVRDSVTAGFWGKLPGASFLSPNKTGAVRPLTKVMFSDKSRARTLEDLIFEHMANNQRP